MRKNQGDGVLFFEKKGWVAGGGGLIFKTGVGVLILKMGWDGRGGGTIFWGLFLKSKMT